VADPESFHWVGIQYRNSALQYAIVLTTVLRYLGRRESGVVLSLPETWLGPPLSLADSRGCISTSLEGPNDPEGAEHQYVPTVADVG
jgi:hypothetical protein